MWRLALIAMCVGFLLTVNDRHSDAQESLPADIVQSVKAATVYLKTTAAPHEMRGSGFVIHTEGDSALIATNRHVIARPKDSDSDSPGFGLRRRDPFGRLRGRVNDSSAPPEVSVVFNSGTGKETVLKADVLDAREEPDLAILKVSGIKDPPKPLPMAKSPQFVETTTVYLFGFPFGDVLTTSKGHPAVTVGKGTISSIRLNDEGRIAKVQIDGTIHPGNSGGPLVDGKGNLLGIAVEKIAGTNIGLVIPSTELTPMLSGQPGKLSITARRDGSRTIVEAIVPVIDPLKKLKSVTLHYVARVVPVDASKRDQLQLSSVSGGQTIDLPLSGGVARATLPMSPNADQMTLDLTGQLAYVNDQGKTAYTEPQVVRVSLRATTPVVAVSDSPPVDPFAALDEEPDRDSPWTKNISKMSAIPDRDVAGKLDGMTFAPDKSVLRGGTLNIRQGTGAYPELAAYVVLNQKPNEELSGRKIVVRGRVAEGDPTVMINVLRPGEKVPKVSTHLTYLLVLEFGQFDGKTQQQPGKIYLCLPDSKRSFVAGVFAAQVEK